METITYCSFDEVDVKRLKYAIIFARYRGKWALIRNRKRGDWESPAGHIEPGETAWEAARRELREETGALEADISLISYYKVEDYGGLFYGEIKRLGPIQDAEEIEELRFYDTLPADLTYPDMHPVFFRRVQGWLNMQTAKGEPWDVYDADRQLTGRIMRRGEPIAVGDYHLVVYIWTKNAAGQFLLTKRAPNKGYGNLWECTGGSAVAGEDSRTAAVREVREETGVVLDPAAGEQIYTYRREDAFCDVWLFRQEFDLDAVTLQEGETADVRSATKDEVLSLYREKKLVPYSHFDEIFAKL